MTSNSRYPYTYACDLIRSKAGYSERGINLSRSNASQIRQLFAKVLGIPDDELARKLADFYLANEDAITAENLTEFQQATEYFEREKAKK